MVVQNEWARCVTTILEEQTLKESDRGSMTKCKLSAAGPPPDRQDSSILGKQEALCIPSDIFWSLLVGIKGEKFDVEGLGVCGS